MRTFVRILLGGFVAFMFLAVGQEWEFFSTAWLGKTQGVAVASEEDREGATDAVRQLLLLMGHLYGTGGDPRFAERAPASPAVIDEMMAEIEYLARNHRRQEPNLQKVEMIAVKPQGTDRVEVRTREFWITRTYWLVGDGSEADPARSQVVNGRYLVAKRSSGWQVQAWDFDAPTTPSEAGGAP